MNKHIPLIRTFSLLPARRAAGALLACTALGLGACQTNSTAKSDQPATPTGEQRFAMADKNHDGKLSRDEMSDYLVNKVFDASDTNHDGRLTQEEWSGADPSTLPDFKKRDANHDGVVTKEEALEYGRQHGIAKSVIKQADKNGDGKLSYAEVKAYYASKEGSPQ